MKITTKAVCAAMALALAAAGCGDDSSVAPDSRPTVDPDAASPPKTFRQVEHLARPGINEALLISHAFNAGYNATAPSFAGVPAATLDMVVAEAKTVLKALYLGVCLVNGAVTPPFLPTTGLKPGAFTCVEVGPAIFEANGTIKATVAAGAQAYADRVFSHFVPDVMRIDFSLATSTYENVCGDPTMMLPLLCGGRFLDDDTIDTTYDYLLNGVGLGGPPAATQGAAAVYNQVSALVSDGVNFQAVTANNKNNRVPSDPSNTAQFHPVVNNAFPYSANPL